MNPNITYRHACFYKLSLIAGLLFIAAFFAFCADAQSAARPRDYQAPGTGVICLSIPANPNVPANKVFAIDATLFGAAIILAAMGVASITR